MRWSQSFRKDLRRHDLLEAWPLLSSNEADMLEHPRSTKFDLIFHEPMTRSNPVLTIGPRSRVRLRRHQDLSKSAAVRQAGRDACGLVISPEHGTSGRAEYPHQLSCGMRQRAMIAKLRSACPAGADRRRADTALDLTIRRQIRDRSWNSSEQLGHASSLITTSRGLAENRAARKA